VACISLTTWHGVTVLVPQHCWNQLRRTIPQLASPALDRRNYGPPTHRLLRICAFQLQDPPMNTNAFFHTNLSVRWLTLPVRSWEGRVVFNRIRAHRCSGLCGGRPKIKLWVVHGCGHNLLLEKDSFWPSLYTTNSLLFLSQRRTSSKQQCRYDMIDI
jgi:hypothetical protein